MTAIAPLTSFDYPLDPAQSEQRRLSLMRTTENTAIFGSIEFDFTDSLTGTIEVRHDR